RSRELNTAAILLGGTAAVLIFGGLMVNALKRIMTHNMVLEREAMFDTSTMLRQLGDSAAAGLLSLLPLFGVLLVLAILAPMALGGWNFSMKAIQPKASRMNPAAGLGRMFGTRALMELAKAIAKVLVVAGLALLVLFLNTDNILGIQREETLP